MEKLRCSGCKANLRPPDKSVQFITCEYCRSTVKNPKFREAPPVVNHNQNINQESSQHTQQPRNNDAEILTSLLKSIPLMSGPRMGRRRRFGRRRGRCGCGCGCLVVIIFIVFGFSLLRFILEIGFDEMIYWIEQLFN